MKKTVVVALLALIVGAVYAEPIDRSANHVYYYMRDVNSALANVTIDSASVDTTITLAVRPGTQFASTVKATHTDDVMDFLLVLETAIVEGTWKRYDSVTITDTTTWFVLWDTLATGQPAALWGKYVRMILDPIDAQYVPADTHSVEITLIGNEK